MRCACSSFLGAYPKEDAVYGEQQRMERAGERKYVSVLIKSTTLTEENGNEI